MKHRTLCLLAVCALLCTPSSNSLLIFYGPGNMGVPSSPPGLKELVNKPSRFAGKGLNFDHTAYYTGDTLALNDFLAELSHITDARSRVVLHTARNRISMKQYDGTGRTIEADWSLRISEFYKGRDDVSEFKGKRTLTTVDVYLTGQISLTALFVPTSIDVQSGYEIEGFIKQHQQKQQSSAAP